MGACTNNPVDGVIMAKVVSPTVFGNVAYPECPNAGEFHPGIQDCHCECLRFADECGFDGTFWCGVAHDQTPTRCPIDVINRMKKKARDHCGDDE